MLASYYIYIDKKKNKGSQMGITKKTRTVEVSPPPTPMKFLLKATLPHLKIAFCQKILTFSRKFLRPLGIFTSLQ